MKTKPKRNRVNGKSETVDDEFPKAAQDALDGLWNEKLISFQLTASQVKEIAVNEFLITFDKPQPFTILVHLPPGRPFKRGVREAVLKRFWSDEEAN